MSNADMDVLVIGAGVTGAVIASTLADAGLRVAVMEALNVGSGATRRALGVVTIDPREAHFADTARGLSLLRQMAERRGVMLQTTPALHLATSPEREAALRQMASAHSDSHLEWLADTRRLPDGFAGGLLAHDSALVDLDLLVMRLLQHPNITVRQGAEAIELGFHKGRTWALAQGFTVPAQRVVLATNAYSGLLSPYLSESVRMARGMVFTSHPLNDHVPGHAQSALQQTLPILVNDASLMLAPARDSRVKAAAWAWEGGDADPYFMLRGFLRRLGGDLSQQAAQWNAGVTTVTDDGAPLVGQLAGEGNVLYALGLGPFGLAWAPIVAERIAALAQ
jgi:glycine/D-amino acid oxidase-like deaminating enzyme